MSKSRNAEFEDVFDSINNIAVGKKFQNGRAWASAAKKSGELSYQEFCDYNNCHDLRVRFSHGNARDIEVSVTTLNMARDFLIKIKHSKLSGTYHKGETHSLNNTSNRYPRARAVSKSNNSKNNYQNYNNRYQKPYRPANLSMYGYEAETLLKRLRSKGKRTDPLGASLSLERALHRELYDMSKSELDMLISRYRMDIGSIFESKWNKCDRIAKHIVKNIPYYEMKYIMTL